MPGAWQLEMVSPVPWELTAQIRHNTARGYDKHRVGGAWSRGEMGRCCLHALSALLFFLLKTVKAPHPRTFWRASRRSVTLQPPSDDTAWAGTGSTASPGKAEPSTLELELNSPLGKLSGLPGPLNPPRPSAVPSTRSQWCTGTVPLLPCPDAGEQRGLLAELPFPTGPGI